MSKKPELLPCPFCGGDELAWGSDYSPFRALVECHSCEAVIAAASVADAIAAWNRRAGDNNG